MTSKTGRRFVIALGAVLCLGLWPADGAAQSSAWKEARTAAVEAYRAGEIGRKTLGAGHPLVAQSLEHYAVLMIVTGRDAEARRAQTFAASIRERNAKANEPKPEDPNDQQKPAVHILKTSD